MPAQLDAGAANVLHRHVTALGLRVHCATATASIEAGADGTVRTVRLSDGTVLDADLAVFAAGVRPRDELADAMGLVRGERGGVVVDEFCRTADERVWAIGDCAAVQGRLYGLVAPGYRMADSVAHQLTGQYAEPFDGADTSTTLKLLGVRIAVFGVPVSDGEPMVEVAFAEGSDRYAKVLLSPDSGHLMGGVLAGDTGSWAAVRSFIGHQPPADLEQLLLP